MGKKEKLRKTSLRLIEKLKTKLSLSIEDLIGFGLQEPEIMQRFIRFSGKAEMLNGEQQRVSLFFQGSRIDVNQDSRGNWYSEIQYINPNQTITLELLNSEKRVTVNLANLFNVSFEIGKNGQFTPIFAKSSESKKSKIVTSFFSDEPLWDKVFSTSSHFKLINDII